jgi:hypothetical protein
MAAIIRAAQQAGLGASEAVEAATGGIQRGRTS